jgi:anti-sigma factor RsiW
MGLSSVRQRTERLSTDENNDRDKARAVRARQRAIGRELRRIFDGVVNEPVPDDFMDLLRKIDESGDTGGPGKKTS